MCVILVLTVIVAGFAMSMKTEMTLARNADYDNELEWMGRSGIELARYQLANKCPDANQRGVDSLDQAWAGGNSTCSNGVENVPMQWDSGRGSFKITIVDMERKWNINRVADPRAPQMDILKQAMQEVGVTDEEKASTIIDSIIDWISPAEDAHFSGAKSEYYLSLNPPYTCKNGFVEDLSELLLVKGMTPEIFWGTGATNHPESAYHQSGGATTDTAAARGFRNDHPDVYPIGFEKLFSPMGGLLNINTAPPETLALIPGIDEPAAERIVQQRSETPITRGEAIDGLPPVAAEAIWKYVGVSSSVFEVHVDAEINGYKRKFGGVVNRVGPSASQTKCIRFYWED
jgi:general secretion pathway protein K